MFLEWRNGYGWENVVIVLANLLYEMEGVLGLGPSIDDGASVKKMNSPCMEMGDSFPTLGKAMEPKNLSEWQCKIKIGADIIKAEGRQGISSFYAEGSPLTGLWRRVVVVSYTTGVPC